MTRFALLFTVLPLFSLELLDGSAQHVLEAVRPFLPARPVLVEAGAYDGEDSARIARFFPLGKLHAFEPVPELFRRLQTATLFYRNIRRHPQALSDHTGRARFYVSAEKANPYDILAAGSLLLPKEHLDYAPQVAFPYTIEVETLTLDDWACHEGIGQVDFLWLDMQGHELAMLNASKIARLAKAIYTEVIFVEAYAGQPKYPEVKAWMAKNGFVPYAADFDEERLGDRWYGNVLFVSGKYLGGRPNPDGENHIGGK